MEQATASAGSKSVELVTDIPGPRSRELTRRKDAAVANAMSVYAPIAIERAEGALLTDVDGNTLIDFGGGVGCLNVGHANPHVLDAIIEQVKAVTHTDFTVTMYASYIELAERITATLPISGPTKAAFFNSGAEAVENGIKIAKAATGRHAVICFERAFHGRTMMAMTLTSKIQPYKRGFGPFAGEVYRAPYPSPFHDGLSPNESADAALAALRRMFEIEVAPESVAAIIFEPIQGEGGFIVPPASFVVGLRAICDEYGIVLIDDEVQAGMGRTGKMWAIEHTSVEPDLILTAKSIAMGLPLSGVLGKATVMDAAPDSSIGGTFVGNPVACAAGVAVLDELEGGLLQAGVALGEKLRSRFEALQAKDAGIGDVRGVGPMLALELVAADGRTPDATRAAAVAKYALEHGLLLLKAGVKGNCLRVLVPLSITDQQVDDALAIIEAALAAV